MDCLAILGCDAHFNSELRQNHEINQDILLMKLSPLDVVFSSLNFVSLRSRNSLHGDIKLGYPLQNTQIRPLKRKQPRFTILAPCGICECVVSNAGFVRVLEKSLNFEKKIQALESP